MIFTLVAFTLAACGTGSGALNHKGVCDDYPEWSTSKYILPWEVGKSYLVTQKSCGGFSHTGNYRYAYDFGMEIGEKIHAARAGVVVQAKGDSLDGVPGQSDNHVYIQHSDGTIAQYLHLTENGALVILGDIVVQGQLIGHSGNTGRSTGPHLHFAVVENGEIGAKSLPVSFSNTDAQIMGLEEDREYQAQSFIANEFE